MLLCFFVLCILHICGDDHKFQLKHKQISRIFGRVEVIEKE